MAKLKKRKHKNSQTVNVNKSLLPASDMQKERLNHLIDLRKEGRDNYITAKADKIMVYIMSSMAVYVSPIFPYLREHIIDYIIDPDYLESLINYLEDSLVQFTKESSWFYVFSLVIGSAALLPSIKILLKKAINKFDDDNQKQQKLLLNKTEVEKLNAKEADEKTIELEQHLTYRGGTETLYYYTITPQNLLFHFITLTTVQQIKDSDRGYHLNMFIHMIRLTCIISLILQIRSLPKLLTKEATPSCIYEKIKSIARSANSDFKIEYAIEIITQKRCKKSSAIVKKHYIKLEADPEATYLLLGQMAFIISNTNRNFYNNQDLSRLRDIFSKKFDKADVRAIRKNKFCILFFKLPNKLSIEIIEKEIKIAIPIVRILDYLFFDFSWEETEYLWEKKTPRNCIFKVKIGHLSSIKQEVFIEFTQLLSDLLGWNAKIIQQADTIVIKYKAIHNTDIISSPESNSFLKRLKEEMQAEIAQRKKASNERLLAEEQPAMHESSLLAIETKETENESSANSWLRNPFGWGKKWVNNHAPQPFTYLFKRIDNPNETQSCKGLSVDSKYYNFPPAPPKPIISQFEKFMDSENCDYEDNKYIMFESIRNGSYIRVFYYQESDFNSHPEDIQKHIKKQVYAFYHGNKKVKGSPRISRDKRLKAGDLKIRLFGKGPQGNRGDIRPILRRVEINKTIEYKNTQYQLYCLINSYATHKSIHNLAKPARVTSTNEFVHGMR